MSEKIYPVAVIGGGSAGVMAALRCVLNNDEVLFFPGAPKDKKKSRAMWVRKIENMPPTSITSVESKNLIWRRLSGSSPLSLPQIFILKKI